MERRSQAFDFPRVAWHELVKSSAARLPDKPALLFRDRPWTYREVLEQGERVARGLSRLGIRPGDRVLLGLRNRPEYVLGLYAASRLGAIAVPMNASYKTEEARYHLDHSGARLALLEPETWERLRAIRGELRALEQVVVVGEDSGDLPWETLRAEAGAQLPSPERDPAEEVFVILYSSGTTGRPKGVMLTHQNVVASHHQYLAAGKVGADDVSLVFVPACHVYGLNLVGGALAAGATQLLLPRYRLETCLDLVQRHRVTLFYATTAVLIELGQFPRLHEYDLSSVRYINSGGAPLPPEVGAKVEKLLGIRVANGYGMTEAPISGYRVPGEERRVVDPESGREVGPFMPGEILIRGPHVMKGYWRDPEETRRVLRDGWLWTGDVGYLDEAGRIRVVARRKELIKYKGFAVSPLELEGLLLDHPAVADCAVVAKPDPLAGEVPKAFVVLAPGARATPEELMAFVGGRVAEYKRIREVAFVEEIPRNASGKIMKRLLVEEG